ncbi:MAG: hypothetical protein ACP5TH_00625 [Fervidicoccaceae archaeon]
MEMGSELEVIERSLSGKVAAVFHALEIPESCRQFLLDPLGVPEAVWSSCIFSLRERKKDEERVLSGIVERFRVLGIIYLSPSLAEIEREKLEEVKLLGEPEKVFCRSCGRDFERSAAQKECPSCKGILLPAVEPLRKQISRKIDRALRLSMISDVLLVLGRADQLSPGAMIPWTAKVFGGRELVVVSDRRSSLSQIADVFIEGDPVKIFP